MSHALELALSFLAVARQNCNVESLWAHVARISCSKHLLPCIVDLLNRTVIEFKHFAFKRYNDVFCPLIFFDLLKLVQLSFHWFGIFYEWVFRSKEFLEDLVRITAVDVATELVRSLHDSVHQTVLTIFVENPFHQGITEDFIGLAKCRESLQAFSLHRLIISDWM